jgi:arylsulfatase A-like enzyme
MVMGMQQGEGLPWGHHGTLVQTPDLALTLMDLMDLRSNAERRGDGEERSARSLKPLIHGWTTPPVHERLFFADIGHAAVRTKDWKLISPIEAPWQLRDESVMLFALGDDPAEQHDLVSERRLGPAGRDLLQRLRAQLDRPETLGSRQMPSGSLGATP